MKSVTSSLTLSDFSSFTTPFRRSELKISSKQKYDFPTRQRTLLLIIFLVRRVSQTKHHLELSHFMSDSVPSLL